MPMTRSSADLINNFNEILQYCQNYKEPLFISNNGQSNLAIMSQETYEQLIGIGKQRIYSLLEEGIQAVKEGRVYTEEEADRLIEAM